MAPNGSPTAALSDDINESSHLIAECRLSSTTIARTFDDDRTLRPGLSRRHTWQRQMTQEERRAGCMWKVTAINKSSDLRILLGWFQNVAPGIYRVQCSSQDLEVAGLERPRLPIIHTRGSYVAGLKWFGCGVDEAVLAVLLVRRKHKADFRFTVLLAQLVRSLCLYSSARPTVHDTVPPPAKQGSLRGAGRIGFCFLSAERWAQLLHEAFSSEFSTCNERRIHTGSQCTYWMSSPIQSVSVHIPSGCWPTGIWTELTPFRKLGVACGLRST